MWKKFLSIDTKLLLVIGLFTGIVISALTVKTLAYTDSPDFCSSCHIMDDVHDSMTASTHAGVSCGDCHLPHDGTAKKLTFKAKSGLSHVYYNTIGTSKIPDILTATNDSKDAVNANCVSCHENTVENIEHDAKDTCMDCHMEVPHGKEFKTKDFDEPPEPGELLNTKGGL